MSGLTATKVECCNIASNKLLQSSVPQTNCCNLHWSQPIHTDPNLRHLLHKNDPVSQVVDGRANALIEALQKESVPVHSFECAIPTDCRPQVNVHWGPRLLKSLPQAGKTAVDSFRVEYGSLDCAVEVHLTASAACRLQHLTNKALTYTSQTLQQWQLA